MSGFSFPPPPPPPPKPAQPQQNSRNRGRPQGRGGFRGDHNQRGSSHSHVRGNHASNASQRSGYLQQGGRPNEYRQNDFDSTPNQSWSNLPQAQSGFQNQALPAGAFINPNFAGAQIGLNGNQHKAFGTSRHAASPNFDAPFGQQNNQAQSPSRTAAGHKRKLDALRGAPREKKPAPPTAPSIPSFGASSLPAKPFIPGSTLQPKESIQLKTKPTGKSLGLTPSTGEPRYPSSDSEDDGPEVDEEAAYAELGNKLTFEHNGVLTSLNSQADLAAWKRERKKNWPTQERKAEKYQERHRIGEERKRLLASARLLGKPLRRDDPTTRGQRGGSFRAEASNVVGAEGASLQSSAHSKKPETELDKARREVEERTKQLEHLRKRVAESEEKNRKARARQSLDTPNSMASKMESEAFVQPPTIPSAQESGIIDADGEADEVEEEAEPSDDSSLESSSVVSSDSSPAEDSDDERPEEIASKPPVEPTPSRPTPVCKYFAASGYCRDGDACRFRHEGPSKQPGSVEKQQGGLQRQQYGFSKFQRPGHDTHVRSKGIFERLREQDEAEEYKLALKVIKYLGGVGFFKEVALGEGE